MKSFPFDSHVSYDKDGVPIFDRAIDSTVYRGLLGKLFTTGVSAEESTNLQVVANGSMAVSILAGFAVIEGAMTLNEDETSLTIEAADRMYDRIDTVVIRLDNNDDVRNCELHVIKGTPSANPQRPSLTREASIYEIGLADVYVRVGATSINSSDITDTRYEAERCGIVTAAGDVGDFIRALSERVRELEAGATAEDGEHFQFAYDEKSDKYGYKVKNEILPFGGGGMKINIDGIEQEGESFGMVIGHILTESIRLPSDRKGVYAALDENGRIHIIGDMEGDSANTHYMLTETGSWQQLTNLPLRLSRYRHGVAFRDKNKVLNVIAENSHYIWTGSGWTLLATPPMTISTLDYPVAANDADGNTHILMGRKHYMYDCTKWTQMTDNPVDVTYEGSWNNAYAVFDRNNELHILGQNSSSTPNTHYVYRNNVWTQIEPLPTKCRYAVADENGCINLIDSNIHHKYVNGKWLKLPNAAVSFEKGSAILLDDEGSIHMLGQNVSDPTDALKHLASSRIYIPMPR